MKILVVIPTYPKYSGVDYHRLVIQHRRIGELFPDCKLSQINEIDSASVDFLKGFDLVVANRFLSKFTKEDEVIQKLKLANVPYVMDLDDDYKIPAWHILYQSSVKNKSPERIYKVIKHAKAVTCTHELLSQTLRQEVNQPNIYCVPNGIYPEPGEQFEVKQNSIRLVTFGWSGSITHFEDVQLLHDALYYLYGSQDYKDKFRVVYGGYEARDQFSNEIQGVLTCKGRAKEHQYFTFPSMDVKNYARFYDLCNVSLIPLRDNRFNRMKSNLKLIESGFKKKAVIVSDVHPYSPLLKHGINCLVVKHPNDWLKHMRRLIDEPELIPVLAENLYQDVQVQHIDHIAKLRYNAYKSILKNESNN